MQRRTFIASAAALVGSSHSLLAGDEREAVEYGHLRGRFVYDGKPPLLKTLFVKGDLVPIIDESLVVHPENLGIANIAVWLKLKLGEPMPPIHSSYGMHLVKPDATRTKTLTIFNGRFEPHFLLLRTDEQLVVNNADTDASALKILPMNNPGVMFALPPGRARRADFKADERLPANVVCTIHAWMSGRLLVKDHPYFAVSDTDGRFEIRNLPAGEREFQFWHEKSGYVQSVTQGGVAQRWVRGCTTMKIVADETLDLGDVSVSPSLFERVP